ncbi:hypothetical protein HPB47_027334 [Ixodes persulcatus]|uniref:Uncharacterized protein n=1 Tax=Ixodes persulcatus TaxID=34615 RepID=A0AC60PYL9_IXOPE|nr:hypothetical protein HPB47_027334 [Ixodes persulcatus]
MPLQRNAAVCELHFDKQFVSRHFEHVVDGQSVLIERARPFLLPGAVPTVFPNVPSYLSKPVPRKRNPKERLCPPPALHDKRQRMDEVLQPLPGEEPDEPATTTTEPRLAFNHADIAFPSDRWGKHVFSGVPLKVAYSVCLPGPDTSLLCAAKLVLFTVTDDTVTHEVFVRGVKVVLDEPGDPSSILQAVDSMHVCSGAGFLEEFPFARSHSNLTVWNGSLYNKKCTGTSRDSRGVVARPAQNGRAGRPKPSRTSCRAPVADVAATSEHVKTALAKLVDGGFQESLEWLLSSLEDAVEDWDSEVRVCKGLMRSVPASRSLGPLDATSTPLVPLAEAHHSSMEDGDFCSLLRSIGVTPPVDEQEVYWRIPAHMTDAMLQSRIELIRRALQGDFAASPLVPSPPQPAEQTSAKRNTKRMEAMRELLARKALNQNHDGAAGAAFDTAEVSCRRACVSALSAHPRHPNAEPGPLFRASRLGAENSLPRRASVTRTRRGPLRTKTRSWSYRLLRASPRYPPLRYVEGNVKRKRTALPEDSDSELDSSTHVIARKKAKDDAASTSPRSPSVSKTTKGRRIVLRDSDDDERDDDIESLPDPFAATEGFHDPAPGQNVGGRRPLKRHEPPTTRDYLASLHQRRQAATWAPLHRTYARSSETSSEKSSESYSPLLSARHRCQSPRSCATRYSGPCSLKLSSTCQPPRNRRGPTPPWPDDRHKLPAKLRRRHDVNLQRRSTPNDAKNGSMSDQSDPRREKPTCGERPTDARFVTIAGKPTMSTAVVRTDSCGYAASTPTTRAHATVSDHARSATTYDVHLLRCLCFDVCPVRLHLDVLQHHLSIGPAERACAAGESRTASSIKRAVIVSSDDED